MRLPTNTLKFDYRKQFMHIQEFFHLLLHLLATYSIGIIAGDFNYDLLKMPQNKFLDIFTDHVHMVNKPKHIPGSMADHVYIKKAWMEELFKS